MWDRDKYGIPLLKGESKITFETGRESRRRIRKENRKRTKF